jgi:hypothetical protein
MLLLVFLVLFWGVLRYRVKLSTLPRHCVACGLPVFTLQHRAPPVLERRKSLVAKLKLEQKMRTAALNEGKLSRLDRLKSKLGVTSKQSAGRRASRKIMQIAARTLNWVDRLTQLPASLSTHSPRCPTSQRIKNDVQDMVVHSNLRLWRARVWIRLYYKAYQNRCIKLLFWYVGLLSVDVRRALTRVSFQGLAAVLPDALPTGNWHFLLRRSWGPLLPEPRPEQPVLRRHLALLSPAQCRIDRRLGRWYAHSPSL